LLQWLEQGFALDAELHVGISVVVRIDIKEER